MGTKELLQKTTSELIATRKKLLEMQRTLRHEQQSLTKALERERLLRLSLEHELREAQAQRDRLRHCLFGSGGKS